MEPRNKRPRVRRGYKPEKKYKALYPEYFGFNPGVEVLFKQTPNGYKAEIDSKTFIGFPRYLIERNPHIFKEIK